jgi:hypothetical protein
LEKVLTVLLVISLGFTWTRQFALLADRNEAGAESQSQTGADKEASGLEADDNIGLFISVDLKDVELQAADEGFVQSVVGENRKDIFEQDTRGREIRKLAQGSAQLYLKTGEFGGAGGIGGGVSGDLGGVGGIGR